MKIGVDVRCLLDRPLSGVGEYAEKLLGALLDLPTDDRFVFFASGRQALSLPREWPQPRYQVRRSNIPNRFLNATFGFLGKPKLEQFVGDLDVFFVPNMNFLPETRMPIALTIHDLSFLHFPEHFSPRRRLWHRLINPRSLTTRAAGLIAVSQATAEDLRQTLHVPADHVFTVLSGIERVTPQPETLTAVRSRFRLPNHFLFSLGTLEPRKNLVTLLDSFALLKREYGYTGDLVMAGPAGWSRRAFQQALLLHEYREHIHVLGYVAEEEKHCLYRLAELFLYLSIYEGFGFPPLEALAQGTPVVAGHHSSLAETIGEAGLLVDIHDVREVARASAEVLQNPELRKMYSAQGQMVTTRFTWKRAAEQTRNVFATLIRRYAHRD